MLASAVPERFSGFIMSTTAIKIRNPCRAQKYPDVGAGEAGTMIAREMLRHPEAGKT